MVRSPISGVCPVMRDADSGGEFVVARIITAVSADGIDYFEIENRDVEPR